MYVVFVRLLRTAQQIPNPDLRVVASLLSARSPVDVAHVYARLVNDAIEGIVFAVAGDLETAVHTVRSGCEAVVSSDLPDWKIVRCEPDLLNVPAAWLPDHDPW